MFIIANCIFHVRDVVLKKIFGRLVYVKASSYLEVETITIAIIIKYCLPNLNTEQPSIFSVLFASVERVSDNLLGDFYDYCGTKTGLNMIVKNASIEIGRRNKQAIIIGPHPETVDNDLTKSFQSNVLDSKLFSVLENLNSEQTERWFFQDEKKTLP